MPSSAQIRAFAKLHNMHPADVQRLYEQGHEDQCWMNDVYQVRLRHLDDGPMAGWTYLSVKRLDKKPIHDWRDLQAIKNQLLGPECEAVELYPAESRLTDGANQYHLFGSMLPGYRFPFGWDDGRKVDGRDGGDAGYRQRPLED